MPGCHAIAFTVTLSAVAAYTLQALPRPAMPPLTREPAVSRSGSPIPLVPGQPEWTLEREPDAEPEHPRLDVYGNELADAVARYTIDARGTAYEEHSPTTEVVRLQPPTT